MLEIAVKVLSVIVGIVAAVAVYPWLNGFLLAILAFIGAVAVGIIAGYVAFVILSWILSSVNRV